MLATSKPAPEPTTNAQTLSASNDNLEDVQLFDAPPAPVAESSTPEQQNCFAFVFPTTTISEPSPVVEVKPDTTKSGETTFQPSTRALSSWLVSVTVLIALKLLVGAPALIFLVIFGAGGLPKNEFHPWWDWVSTILALVGFIASSFVDVRYFFKTTDYDKTWAQDKLEIDKANSSTNPPVSAPATSSTPISDGNQTTISMPTSATPNPVLTKEARRVNASTQNIWIIATAASLALLMYAFLLVLLLVPKVYNVPTVIGSHTGVLLGCMVLQLLVIIGLCLLTVFADDRLPKRWDRLYTSMKGKSGQ